MPHVAAPFFANAFKIHNSENTMKYRIYLPATAICLTLLFNACSKSSSNSTTTPTTPDCSTAKSFATDVAPIVSASCATNSGCHATGSANGPGALMNYTQIYNNRTAIRAAVANGTMPQGSSLSTAQKNAILCWVDAGAPNN